ncbi:MAG: GlsB/YeaQ/YmgE family stress response membrane protein [Rhodoplanes sp.]
MSIIGWIILGLIAGYIGSRIVDKEGKGLWLNLALGIVGAIVGGLIFRAFGFSGVTGVDLYSMIVAIIGSIVVLWVYHATAGRRPV